MSEGRYMLHSAAEQRIAAAKEAGRDEMKIAAAFAFAAGVFLGLLMAWVAP